MKIAHVSDLHIRNFKYRDEYKKAFENLYAQLRELKPDLIINTGDTVHSKLAVSPELFDDVATHCLKMSSIAPYWIILGNHDLNLKNTGRTDAISPIVRAIHGRTEHGVELMDDGPGWGPNESYWWERSGDAAAKEFWHYDIRRRRDPSKFKIDPEKINIGLYHGSISGCVTDIGFVMEEGESEISKFDGMDYVLMGDIHKRQSFRDGRIRYPGSLIQQNYGEELVKGFLLWEITSKTDFNVDFHAVEAPGRFYTIQVPQSLDVTGLDIPKGSRIRAELTGELSPSKRVELEKRLRDVYSPLEVITPDSSGERLQMSSPDIDEVVGSREKLSRDHLKERGLAPDVIDEVMRLYREYEAGLDADTTARGTTWQLKRLAWNNMLNYGEGNFIDMTKLSGLVGIFAPNASGKSSIFDIMLQALYDKIAKEVPRNIDLVNDNKDIGTMSVEFESGGHPYSIERSIERIHYGQRKLAETKQWGKTTLDFSSIDDSLNGTSRPETEREIRAIVGSFEDFVLSTMVTQAPIFGLPGGADLINCRETDRRKILFRFLDLDVYERISAAIKDDLKTLMASLKGTNREQIEGKLATLAADRASDSDALSSARNELAEREERVRELTQDLMKYEIQSIKSLEESLVDDEARLGIALVKYELASDEHGRCCHELDVLRARLATFVSPPECPSIGLDEISDKVKLLRKEHSSMQGAIAVQKDTIAKGKTALKTIQDIPCESKFPSCKFIKDAVSFVETHDDVQRALDEIVAQKGLVDAELTILSNYEVKHRAVADWEREATGLELAVSRATAAMDAAWNTAQQRKDAYGEIQKRLDSTRDSLTKMLSAEIGLKRKLLEENKKEVSTLQSDVDRLLMKLGANEANAATLQKKLDELDGLKEKIAIHEHLAEMCGKNGLPYRILTLVLPVINFEISKILTGLVKFSVFFEDDPEEQSVSLSIRYGDYKSRPLSLGSGAEKFIASLAIRVALLSVSSLPKTDMLIIDEGFGKLDPEHLEALQRMFEYLKQAFGTVFVVSHVDFMRDIVDHSIEITSQDGYAHVEVG